ncbi:MAG: c-type cytochrome, partial [Alphaproteobacteria bacterium]|nr:c-type cytochrome [Alphaproteobacteria bacterium]
MKKLQAKLLPILVSAIILAGLGSMIYRASGSVDSVEITEIQFTSAAQNGKVAYDNTCAACHGESAKGTDSGPPFLHKVYHPGHHGNESFIRAM